MKLLLQMHKANLQASNLTVECREGGVVILDRKKREFAFGTPGLEANRGSGANQLVGCS